MYTLYYKMQIFLQYMNKFDIAIIIQIFRHTLIGQPKHFRLIFYDKQCRS